MSMGTRNARTLRSAGKLEELTHGMDRYHWNVSNQALMSMYRTRSFPEADIGSDHDLAMVTLEFV